MHLNLLSQFVICFLFIYRTSYADKSESVIAFEPHYLSITVGQSEPVNVRLLVPDIIPPDVFIKFLYDDKPQQTLNYIDILPNITFSQQTSTDQSSTIIVRARHNGHLVITAQSPQVNISSFHSFLLIDIALSNILSLLIQIVGWIYFFAWSISFYPQIILNFRRQSVVGLNFDFLALNLLGHSCYCIFNICLYTSRDVQQQYYAKHLHGILPVLLNDVLFSVHAVFACFITVGQCVFFERGKQRVSYLARTMCSLSILFLLISSIVSLTNHLSTLNLLYFFSYVKLVITMIKYVPQAWMNYRRKSTEGWSIGNILLDFTGGVLSLLQMFLLAINYNDWSSIFGSPTKLGLGLISILFDIVFIVQHYILYRPSRYVTTRNNLPTDIEGERTPILRRPS